MLQRLSNAIASVTVGTTAAASGEILMGSYALGIVIVPAGSSITSLTWYVADKPGGTYYPLTNEEDVAVATTVAHTNAYQLPTSLSGAVSVKAVGDAAGEIALVLKA